MEQPSLHKVLETKTGKEGVPKEEWPTAIRASVEKGRQMRKHGSLWDAGAQEEDICSAQTATSRMRRAVVPVEEQCRILESARNEEEVLREGQPLWDIRT